MNKEINAILDGYHDEMIGKLQKILKIKSVLSAEKPGAPFGEGIDEALKYAMTMGENKGFECVNFDNYACELNMGEGKTSVGVVTHLDVVPEGEGWNFDPYGGVISDGKIYGRGAVDDKGAFIASFYACLAIKESGLPISKKIKHIIGTNEESGEFPCIQYYKEHAEMPECGIVPDSWFPVAYAEKDLLNFNFYKKMNSKIEGAIVLSSLKGGEAYNVVAPDAEAQFLVNQEGLNKLNADIENLELDDRVKISTYENKVTIKVYGKAAHASTPEIGINAISLLLNILQNIKFEPMELCTSIHELAKQVGKDSDGAGLNVKCKDHTGELTNNVGIISYDGLELSVKMNIRCPVTVLPEELEDKLKAAAKKAGMKYKKVYFNPHFYMPEDNALIKLLVGVYQEMTGDMETKPKAHGGGSYARILKNFVPFGPSIEGEELCFHKQDEHISCERLLLLSKIYAQALYELAR